MDLEQIQAALKRRYRLERELGRGGMGVVYQAYQESQQRRVALKVIATDLESDADWAARLAQEARLAARISHPNVVRVFDYDTVGEAHRWAFIAYELVEGESLRALMEREAPLDPDRVRALGSSIAAGLEAIHAAGILHRDLKPENVLLSQHGPKITDLGIAKEAAGDQVRTKSGVLLGTPHYMAPEQILGQACGPAVDVYAFGVMLFEMLAGRVPYDAPQVGQLLEAHVNAAVPLVSEMRGGVPHDLTELVAACMEKDAGARPAAAALAPALGPGGSGVVKRPSGAPSRKPSSGKVTVATMIEGASGSSNTVPIRSGPAPRPESAARPPALGRGARALILGFSAALALVAWRALAPMPPAGGLPGVGAGAAEMAVRFGQSRAKGHGVRIARLERLLADPLAQALRDRVDELVPYRFKDADNPEHPLVKWFLDEESAGRVSRHGETLEREALALQAELGRGKLSLAGARALADALLLRVEHGRLWTLFASCGVFLTESIEVGRWHSLYRALRKPLPDIEIPRGLRSHRSKIFARDGAPIMPALEALAHELGRAAAAGDDELYRSAMRWWIFVWDLDDVDRASPATEQQASRVDAMLAAALPGRPLGRALAIGFRTQRTADGWKARVADAYRLALAGAKPGPLWDMLPDAAITLCMPWSTGHR